MCLRATIRSPLRSKRAMISPVRPRANASGLTRISVFSIGEASYERGESGAARRSCAAGGAARPRALRRHVADRRLLGVPAAAARHRRLAGDLGLAVGADLPLGIQRLGARAARVLELA